MTAGFEGGKRWKRAVAGAAMAPAIVAALLAHGPAARAQQDYQLPSATPTPTPPPRAAGPVAEGAPPPTPVVSPTGAQPAIVLPTPRATPTPTRTPTPAAAPTTTPDRRLRPEARPTPAAPAPSPIPVPAASTTPEPLPEADASPAPSLAPEPEAAPSGAPVVSTPDSNEPAGDWLWWIGGGALALVALALTVWARRRNATAPAEMLGEEPEAALAEAPAPTPQPVPVPRPAPTSPRPPAPTPPPAAPRGLVLTLEAVRLGATLVNTTLAYRLTATNAGPDALSDIAISGDMTAAHASRSMEEQLGIAGPELPPIGRIERLEPGESAVLEGEFRLPLAAVTPIRHGQAQLFVPVARFDAWASDSAHRAVSARAAFLVGQDNATASDRLQPFRLDLGPRVWDAIGQRALEIPETL